MPVSKKTQIKPITEIILVTDAHGEGLGCALCGEEDGTLRVTLTSAVNKKAFAIVIGPHCRLFLEAGLRGHRKWEIRGGREYIKEKMGGVKDRKYPK